MAARTDDAKLISLVRHWQGFCDGGHFRPSEDKLRLFNEAERLHKQGLTVAALACMDSLFGVAPVTRTMPEKPD